MHARRIIAFALLAVLQQEPAPAPAAMLQEARRLQREALAARAAGDTARFLEAARGASELRPQHAGLLALRAVAELRAGDRPAALATLARIADAGLALDFAADPDLAALDADGAAAALRERMRANAAPRAASAESFTLRDANFCAEGIAHDPRDGSFYLSSFTDGRILRLRGAGAERVEEVFARLDAEGLRGAYGMAVDAPRGGLWVAGGAARGAASETDRGILLSLDLATGARRLRVEAPAGGLRLFGDVAIGEDGGELAILVSDPVGGGIHLRSASGGLSALVPPGVLASPQGMVVLPRRGDQPPQVVVADYALGLYRVPLRGDPIPIPLLIPEGAALLGVDGLALHGWDLIAIQNGATPSRILRLALDPETLSVTRLEVLERAHPRWGEPTLGVVAGGALHYVANAPWQSPEEHPPGLVLRLPLR